MEGSCDNLVQIKPQGCTCIDKYIFNAKIVRDSSQVIKVFTNVFYTLAAKYSKLSALEEYSRRYENLHTTQRLIKTMAAI